MIIEFKFSPLEQFEWWRELTDSEENIVERKLIGQYIPGMSYNCTKNPVHDALREKCVQWEAEGKIQIMALPAGQKFKTIKVSN